MTGQNFFKCRKMVATVYERDNASPERKMQIVLGTFHSLRTRNSIELYLNIFTPKIGGL